MAIIYDCRRASQLACQRSERASEQVNGIKRMARLNGRNENLNASGSAGWPMTVTESERAGWNHLWRRRRQVQPLAVDETSRKVSRSSQVERQPSPLLIRLPWTGFAMGWQARRRQPDCVLKSGSAGDIGFSSRVSSCKFRATAGEILIERQTDRALYRRSSSSSSSRSAAHSGRRRLAEDASWPPCGAYLATRPAARC